MFKSLPELRDSLLAARLIREEILGQPVLPESAARLRESFLRDNSPPGARRAVEMAILEGRRAGFGVVDAAASERLAATVDRGRRLPLPWRRARPVPPPA